jgi:SRSO17 transposase
MATARKPTAPTTAAIDAFCGQFDDLFCRLAERRALRHYLVGLLLPREHNKTLTTLAALVPGADRQRLHHFLHDAPWEPAALNARRLALWRAHPALGPHPGGVLIVDETGDRKRGHGIALAAQQYIGKLGHTANGVVSVTSHWADGTRHVPLGVKPYRPARRLPQGKADPAFRTKPELAWELIEEARAAGIPFRVVVADCVYGENAKLESRLYGAQLRYVLALRPSHGTWQVVPDAAHPPAFTPAEAAQRVPPEQWRRVDLVDSHGRPLVRYVTELELGASYGPTRPVRLIAATDDPAVLKADATWFMTTNLTPVEADPAEVYCVYRLRDWIEHYYKPAKHELGWADFQVRPERAIVRHWHLVMLAFTFSLLAGAPEAAPTATEPLPPPTGVAGGKIGAASRLASHAARRPRVAVPLGAPSDLLGSLEHGPPAAGVRCPAGPRRTLAPARRPNLTNQR